MAEATGKTYLTLQEAATLYKVSPRTLRRRIAEGHLDAVRVGPRSIRISADDVQNLARKIPTVDPRPLVSGRRSLAGASPAASVKPHAHNGNPVKTS